MIFRDILEIKTKKGMSCLDITKRIAKTVENSGLKDGLCHVYLRATTAGLVINENEAMLLEDFKKLFSLVDDSRLYNHPSNAHAHLRATMASTEKTIPIAEGRLLLGTWQSIFLWEFGTKDREREIIITITGE